VALTKIVEADLQSAIFDRVIKTALAFIFLACVFDLLDGRMARWGGHESPFGREFDSLADLISFGAAPAFLVHRIVLKDVFHSMPELGWFIASIYLICGALRLARFNTLALHSGRAGGRRLGADRVPGAVGHRHQLEVVRGGRRAGKGSPKAVAPRPVRKDAARATAGRLVIRPG
jgi:CDP-diacylglycerol--serine O-phosphatidyltransferase